MSTSNSVSDDDKYISLYREALSNCEQQIIKGLRVMVLGDLTKLGGVTEDELREIEIRHRDRGLKAKEIITLIREKDTLKSYIALSRLLCEIQIFDKQAVFPFVTELEEKGKHSPIQRRPGTMQLVCSTNIHSKHVKP